MANIMSAIMIKKYGQHESCNEDPCKGAHFYNLPVKGQTKNQSAIK